MEEVVGKVVPGWPEWANPSEDSVPVDFEADAKWMVSPSPQLTSEEFRKGLQVVRQERRPGGLLDPAKFNRSRS